MDIASGITQRGGREVGGRGRLVQQGGVLVGGDAEDGEVALAVAGVDGDVTVVRVVRGGGNEVGAVEGRGRERLVQDGLAEPVVVVAGVGVRGDEVRAAAQGFGDADVVVVRADQVVLVPVDAGDGKAVRSVSATVFLVPL
ncbi:hypothetical protein [Streptomyces sp. NPDC005828]|uniref:hypothetical protein n=1 Tax=Streptomyces sp. NPDC005828 TaxID=3157071 RepID=UPI003404902F